MAIDLHISTSLVDPGFAASSSIHYELIDSFLVSRRNSWHQYLQHYPLQFFGYPRVGCQEPLKSPPPI